MALHAVGSLEADEFPENVTELFVAMRLDVERDDLGRTREIDVTLLDPDGQGVGAYSFSMTPSVGEASFFPAIANATLKLTNVRLAQAGVYRMVASLAGLEGQTPQSIFHVRKRGR